MYANSFNKDRGVRGNSWLQIKIRLQAPIPELQKQLEGLRLQIDEAKRRGDYTRASELQYGQIPELEARIVERWVSEQAR